MWAAARRAVRTAPLLTAAFALALCATLWFGGRATLSALYWADPAHRDQQIEGWMTPGYVGRSWGVPPEVTAAALGLTLPREGGRRPPPLEVIARDRGVPLAQLIAELETAIAAYRAASEARP